MQERPESVHESTVDADGHVVEPESLFRERIQTPLGIPPRIFMECAVFLGYGDEALGAPRRIPVAQLSHHNRWGTPLSERR